MMRDKKKVIFVYGAALVQGLALVAFPAASAIFTSPAHFNFSNAAYGGLFIPQAICSIAASLFSAESAARIGCQKTLLWGLIANFLAMALLTLSATVMHESTAYYFLLLATALLGTGFGLAVPALNAFVIQFFPKQCDKAVLYLNALLGAGMAVSPLLITVFVGWGTWWGLPLFLSLVLLGVGCVALSLKLPETKRLETGKSKLIPWLFWLFALFAFLYGIVETVNGNWAVLFMKRVIHVEGGIALLALTCFWAMVTLGRLCFAVVGKERILFRLLPVALAGVLIGIAQTDCWIREIVLFGLSGLFCSALLPLTISLGTQSLPSMHAASLAGGVLSFYLLGYGVAAFGVGPLLDRMGLTLPSIFILAAGIALLLVFLGSLITRFSSR